MAGSVITFARRTLGPVHRIEVEWTSDDTTGAVSGTSAFNVFGRLLRAVTVPSGTAAPSADYDIALSDEESVDVLGACVGGLGDRHTSNTESVELLLSNTDVSPLPIAEHPAMAGPLTVAITNAGNSKAGTLILYVEPGVQ